MTVRAISILLMILAINDGAFFELLEGLPGAASGGKVATVRKITLEPYSAKLDSDGRSVVKRKIIWYSRIKIIYD